MFVFVLFCLFVKPFPPFDLVLQFWTIRIWYIYLTKCGCLPSHVHLNKILKYHPIIEFKDIACRSVRMNTLLRSRFLMNIFRRVLAVGWKDFEALTAYAVRAKSQLRSALKIRLTRHLSVKPGTNFVFLRRPKTPQTFI